MYLNLYNSYLFVVESLRAGGNTFILGTNQVSVILSLSGWDVVLFLSKNKN